MKYFTKEWCFGNLEDKAIDNILRQYKKYIDSIYKQLPLILKILIKNINLHDGIIKRVYFFHKEHSLTVEGLFGDLETGYFFLKIKYLKVSKLNQKTLTSVFKEKKIEILSDEMEILSKNTYSHRMVFSSKKEIEIFFEDIEIEIRNATSKNYKKENCKLEII